jgi:hypothetical protein
MVEDTILTTNTNYVLANGVNCIKKRSEWKKEKDELNLKKISSPLYS